MNILHVVPSYYPATKWGGPILSTKSICDSIIKYPGVCVRVISTNAGSPDVKDNLQVVNSWVEFSEGYKVFFGRRIYGHSTSLSQLIKILFSIRWADVIHVTGVYNFCTIPTIILARVFKIPLVWSLRGAVQANWQWAGSSNSLVKKWYDTFVSKLLSSRNVIHVTSIMELNASRNSFKEAKFEVIPNSIITPTLSSKSYLSDGLVRVMFLSRLHEKKGIELLVEAIKLLPEHFVLDVYGTGEKGYLKSLQRSVVDIEDRVRFHGHVLNHEKQEAFQRADIFCLPSYSENFGIAIGEALAHFVPVIVTRESSWVDVMKEKCGILVGFDSSGIAKSIRNIADRDLEEMGKAGRAYVVDNFSQDVLADRYIKLYSSLIAK